MSLAWLSLALLGAASPSWLADAPREPEKFLPSIVARPDTEESMLTLSSAGDIYWGVSRKWFPMSRVSEIWTARQVGGEWKSERAAFSAGYSDVDSFVTGDGKTVFFVSMRPAPAPRQDFDLYVVDRTDAGFGKARNLGPGVNSPQDDLFPSVADDGTLYYGSFKSGVPHIYRARRLPNGDYGPAESVGEPVNLPNLWSFNPFISPDGKTLVFTAFNRPGGMGKGDIWVATMQPDGTFGDVRNLGSKINTADDEFHPTLSPDRSAFFFIRRGSDAAANADIYWMSAKGLLP
ncbi:PD40 domain-containing protein [Sphingomonas sabuli]|uniref:PD40 domain-containing protein n=1 Tax=Sphingomonas sabuli TaxID=2764186 RepID=A0A7G9L0W6_9SPHN|nr:PD40 domain-containing protein [Sphingomonas sabuli]QNM82265.1 PD40 domain-containing protein [Sphingomonas sabuli]